MYELLYINTYNDKNAPLERVEVDSKEKLGMIILTMLEEHGREFPNVNCFESSEGMFMSITDVSYPDEFIKMEWKEI